MAFHLNDHWVWDHWIHLHEGKYHLYFLRASRALLEPDRRHGRASIGHAISDDAREWTLLPDALVHSDGPAFDDKATWTGSAIAHPDGHIRLFYTGCSHVEDGVVQRIGWADSYDGVTYHRSGAEPIEADPRWYETEHDREWHDVAWRDPYVFHHDGRWHMLITARVNYGDPRWRGVIGYAVSDDLDDWEVQPPLTEPGAFGQMEVAQQHFVEGKNRLVFSTDEPFANPELYENRATSGWFAEGEGPLGPWDLTTARPTRNSRAYAGQLFADKENQFWYTGFNNVVDGVFVGDIPDPLPWSEVG